MNGATNARILGSIVAAIQGKFFLCGKICQKITIGDDWQRKATLGSLSENLKWTKYRATVGEGKYSLLYRTTKCNMTDYEQYQVILSNTV